MRTLDDRLNQAGDEARLQVDQINTRSATSIRSRQQRSRVLVGTVAVAAMFIVLGASGLVMSTEAGQESASEPSTPPVTVAPVAVAEESVPTPTSPPETAVVPPPETTWERIDDDAFAPGIIWAIASTEDVIVAVGEVSDPTDVSSITGERLNGVVWVSTDGHAWERIDDETVFAGEGAQFLDNVVTGQLGIVASGYEWPDAALWFSPDGYVWHKALVDDLGTPGEVDGLAVVAGGPGWVAISADGPTGAVSTGDVVFVSEDGLTWTRIDEATRATELVKLVESGRDREPVTTPPTVAGLDWNYAWDGERVVGVAGLTVVAIWVSEDSGTNWHQIDPVESIFGGYPWSTSRDVTLFGSEFIVGGDQAEGAAIFIGTWEEER